jgi:hypothetical protein
MSRSQLFDKWQAVAAAPSLRALVPPHYPEQAVVEYLMYEMRLLCEMDLDPAKQTRDYYANSLHAFSWAQAVEQHVFTSVMACPYDYVNPDGLQWEYLLTLVHPATTATQLRSWIFHPLSRLAMCLPLLSVATGPQDTLIHQFKGREFGACAHCHLHGRTRLVNRAVFEFDGKPLCAYHYNDTYAARRELRDYVRSLIQERCGHTCEGCGRRSDHRSLWMNAMDTVAELDLVPPPVDRPDDPDNACYLTLDHLDMGQKAFSLRYAVDTGKSRDALKREFDRCRLLCTDCHSLKTMLEDRVGLGRIMLTVQASIRALRESGKPLYDPEELERRNTALRDRAMASFSRLYGHMQLQLFEAVKHYRMRERRGLPAEVQCYQQWKDVAGHEESRKIPSIGDDTTYDPLDRYSGLPAYIEEVNERMDQYLDSGESITDVLEQERREQAARAQLLAVETADTAVSQEEEDHAMVDDDEYDGDVPAADDEEMDQHIAARDCLPAYIKRLAAKYFAGRRLQCSWCGRRTCSALFILNVSGNTFIEDLDGGRNVCYECREWLQHTFRRDDRTAPLSLEDIVAHLDIAMAELRATARARKRGTTTAAVVMAQKATPGKKKSDKHFIKSGNELDDRIYIEDPYVRGRLERLRERGPIRAPLRTIQSRSTRDLLCYPPNIPLVAKSMYSFIVPGLASSNTGTEHCVCCGVVGGGLITCPRASFVDAATLQGWKIHPECLEVRTTFERGWGIEEFEAAIGKIEVQGALHIAELINFETGKFVLAEHTRKLRQQWSDFVAYAKVELIKKDCVARTEVEARRHVT